VLGDGPLERITPHTIVDRDALERELETIRARGWSEDRDEFIEGVSCIAAPALVDGVVLAAYTVSAPTERFERRHDALLTAVQQAAAAAASHPDATEAT
jgi:DNA-binding IclR family transcriptional regulator